MVKFVIQMLATIVISAFVSTAVLKGNPPALLLLAVVVIGLVWYSYCKGGWHD